MLHTLSLIAGVLAALALILGFFPLLGWSNWFLTLPLAILGLILGAIGKSRPGMILNVVVLGLAALRLFLGGGIL